jgi:perosamine synthetase
MTPLYKVYMPDELTGGIEKILYSGNLSFGQCAKEFEEKLRTYIGNNLLFTTSSNNYALLIAFNVIGLKNGDEVIASPMSCLASNQPVASLGGKIVWADIDPSICAIDPNDVKRKITSRTKAILLYHWCGYPGYIDEINEIGREFGIPVIEDAIESFGSEYKEKKIGNTGSDITCFSFQPVRLPTSLDGGALSFRNKELFDKAILMRDYGINRTKFRDEMGEISTAGDIHQTGYNAMMNEVSAYIGFKQMASVEELLLIQKKNGFAYNQQCEEKEIKYLKTIASSKPNYWVYTLFDNNPSERIKAYRENGIYASKVHLSNDYYSVFSKMDPKLVGVREFEKHAFSIPSGWWVATPKIL